MDEPLAQLLDLKEHEADALNDLWEKVRPAVNALQLQHMKSQSLDDGGIWIGVEHFSVAGEALRQNFIMIRV